MRIPQPVGTKGSLKWIQRAVAHRPDLLQPDRLSDIAWVSPLQTDDFAEYRDAAFLDRIGQNALTNSLSDFWPSRGPQWDALGLCAEGPVLVEAKAHIAEFFSPASQAKGASLEKIQNAFCEMQTAEKITTTCDWSQHYYQYANRLAHLWWLRRNGVNAHLLFVSFLNDEDMSGPTHPEAWEAAFDSANYVLGVSKRASLLKYVRHVTPDVREL